MEVINLHTLDGNFINLSGKELMFINGGDQEDYAWGYRWGRRCRNAFYAFNKAFVLAIGQYVMSQA